MAGCRVGRVKIRAVDPHCAFFVPLVRSRGEAAPQKRVLALARIFVRRCRTERNYGRSLPPVSTGTAQFAREFRYLPRVSSSFDAIPRARRAYLVYE